MTTDVELSAIIPITERYDDIRDVYNSYKDNLEKTGKTYEIVYVVDGDFPDAQKELEQISADGENIKIIKLAKWFGEATALSVGFEHSCGELIITLPAYWQIDATEIEMLINSLGDNDMAVARRWPRNDSFLSRMQSRAFHMPLKLLTELDFHDLGCAARVIRRKVVNEISIYGDQHRFLPLLAHRQGFKVIEVDARQAQSDKQQRLYGFGVYVRRLLDIITIFFLLKFTKKPLRFFGMLGSVNFGLGSIILLYLGIERVFLGTPLADRPILLLASLLLVLGFQMLAIGLVGEIIIFTHAKEIKEYTIEKMVN